MKEVDSNEEVSCFDSGIGHVSGLVACGDKKTDDTRPMHLTRPSSLLRTRRL